MCCQKCLILYLKSGCESKTCTLLVDITFQSLCILFDLYSSSEPSEEDEYKDPQLRPQEFLLLLKDLNSKLDHALVASKTKKSFPGKFLV